MHIKKIEMYVEGHFHMSVNRLCSPFSNLNSLTKRDGNDDLRSWHLLNTNCLLQYSSNSLVWRGFHRNFKTMTILRDFYGYGNCLVSISNYRTLCVYLTVMQNFMKLSVIPTTFYRRTRQNNEYYLIILLYLNE